MIKLIDITKSYGNTTVLNGVDIDFEDGAIHGIVGNNGEGKTTLFNCIYGLTDVTKGSIIETNNLSIRKIAGYLPAEPYFYNYITGREYLEFCMKTRNINNLNFLEWNDIFQLPLKRYVSDYSTGMKKKIAFLGILLQENKIYLLDEPFNGLDLETNLILKNILLTLKCKGITIILTSHILSVLTDISDTIFHLKSGKIIKNYYKDEFSFIENNIIDVSISDKLKLATTLIK